VPDYLIYGDYFFPRVPPEHRFLPSFFPWLCILVLDYPLDSIINISLGQSPHSLQGGEQEVTHLLCRVHSKRTLNRRLEGPRNKRAMNHMIAALKYRKTGPGCEESIEAAMAAAPDQGTREYLKKEWWTTREKWANYARTHSCLLLQVCSPGTLVVIHLQIRISLGHHDKCRRELACGLKTSS
jgi:hypothetical protein